MLSDWLKTQKKLRKTNQIRAVSIATDIGGNFEIRREGKWPGSSSAAIMMIAALDRHLTFK